MIDLPLSGFYTQKMDLVELLAQTIDRLIAAETGENIAANDKLTLLALLHFTVLLGGEVSAQENGNKKVNQFWQDAVKEVAEENIRLKQH